MAVAAAAAAVVVAAAAAAMVQVQVPQQVVASLHTVATWGPTPLTAVLVVHQALVPVLVLQQAEGCCDSGSCHEYLCKPPQGRFFSAQTSSDCLTI